MQPRVQAPVKLPKKEPSSRAPKPKAAADASATLPPGTPASSQDQGSFSNGIKGYSPAQNGGSNGAPCKAHAQLPVVLWRLPTGSVDQLCLSLASRTPARLPGSPLHQSTPGECGSRSWVSHACLQAASASPACAWVHPLRGANTSRGANTTDLCVQATSTSAAMRRRARLLRTTSPGPWTLSPAALGAARAGRPTAASAPPNLEPPRHAQL